MQNRIDSVTELLGEAGSSASLLGHRIDQLEDYVQSMSGYASEAQAALGSLKLHVGELSGSDQKKLLKRVDLIIDACRAAQNKLSMLKMISNRVSKGMPVGP